MNKAAIVVLATIIVLMYWLVIVNGVRRDNTVQTSSAGLQCAYGGDLYVNTASKYVVEFDCE